MRSRPLCAFVLTSGNRFCRRVPAYLGADGKHYCGGHAHSIETIGRLLRPRRELYGGRGASRGGADSIIGLILDSRNGQDMTNELVIEATEFNIPDEGLYPATVKNIEAGPPGKFGPTFRWSYAINTEDWPGHEVDELTGRDMTPNAKVSQRYTAATGDAVEPGTTYNLANAIGKAVQIMVKHEASAKGGMWPRIGDVLAMPRKKAKAKAVTVPVTVPADLEEDDDEDDELADA